MGDVGAPNWSHYFTAGQGIDEKDRLGERVAELGFKE